MSVVAPLRLLIAFGNQTISRIFNLRPTNCTEAFGIRDNAVALDISFENAFSLIAGLVFKASGNLLFIFEIVPPLLVSVSDIVPIHARLAPPLPELQWEQIKRRLLEGNGKRDKFLSYNRKWSELNAFEGDPRVSEPFAH